VNVLYENLENILPVTVRRYWQYFICITWDIDMIILLISTSFTQPISRMISSQVTNVSTTSTEYSIQLTFQYFAVRINFIYCTISNLPAAHNSGKLEHHIWGKMWILEFFIKWWKVCVLYYIACNITLLLLFITNRGGWDSTGVTTTSIVNNTITCNSNHLTSFAVLVDVAGGHGVSMVVFYWTVLDKVFLIENFRGRTKGIVCSNICWMWNINYLFAYCNSCANIL